ncbi:MAG: N-acetyltransferase family protein, partial [Parachlamydiaceae bacterium]
MKEAKHPFHFELVQPIREDGLLIMEWRNDSQTLANSYHTTAKVEIPFLYEFFTEYFCFPQLPPLFAVKDGKRVAFLKFEPCEDFAFTGRGRPHRCCALSINVAPEFRGKGIGSALLKAIQPWIQQQGFESLYGEVKVDNQISRKAFLNA